MTTTTIRDLSAAAKKASADRVQAGLAQVAGDDPVVRGQAIETLARNAGLELLHVDLAALASKYIGETEKNLSRLFDQAASSNAVLFLDEADALFGARTSVKDAHDRYASIEVGYLLQRIEALTGLVVLATNTKTSLDPAFLRRLRFFVQLPPAPPRR